MRADLSTLELETELADAPPDTELKVVVDGRGERVFTGVYDGGGGGQSNLAHYRVYDRSTGEVEWEFIDDEWEPEGRRPYLAADGRVAFFGYSPFNEGDNGYSRVLGDSGLIDHFVGLAATSVAEDDWLGIEVGESTPRWRNVGTQSTIQTGHSVWEGYRFRWVRETSSLVYLSEIDGSFNVVEEHGDMSTLRPWPEVDPYLLGGWQTNGFQLEGDYVLLGLRMDDQRRVLRLAADDTHDDLALLPPPGHTALECFSGRPVLGPDGDFVVLWRDGSSASLWSLASVDDEWLPLGAGLPISAFTRASLDNRSGTYWVGARDVNNCVSPPMWNAPPVDALLGASTQLIRPATGNLATVDDYTYPEFSADGSCAARADAQGLEDPGFFEDLLNGETLEAPELGAIRWIAD